ncbi:glycosyltransferase family 39 protein [Sediminicola luteus]|uniref:Glycosyltransferase RgtA/B/C/D-like domain-containing protein n=1 Tax=Sediminicola luteus TaxID=319238 RepID=A0A2A4G8C7_9FLAO|nr:glycosyltransferase family 39 protein [Sediminicola luteus]PCE64224.1 hypothetical protein B7P33_07935 [Sediminicola luteus]
MQALAKRNVLILISVLAIVGIAFMKVTPELEDSEQAYLTQWLQWGYNDQPPLYTWLQYGFNQIFGLNAFSFAFLRALVFGASLWVGFGFYRKVADANPDKALFALLLWVLVPTLIDWTFRRLSHTSLMNLSVLATYWVLFLLMKKRNLKNYLLFGLVLALGMLSKYNYVLVLASFGIGTLVDKRIAKVIFHPKMLLSVSVALLLCWPHFNWVLEYRHLIGERVAEKTAGSGWPVVSTLLSYLSAFLKMVWPLLLFLVWYFWKQRQRPVKRAALIIAYPLFILFVVQAVVVLVVFLFMGIQKVETRWLLPLFLPFVPVLITAMKIPVEKYIPKFYLIFLLVIALQFLRTPVEKVFGIPSAVHYSFKPLHQHLQQHYPERSWLFFDITYAGNIRLLDKQKVVGTYDDFLLSEKHLKWPRVKVITKYAHTPEWGAPTDSITEFGRFKETVYLIDETTEVK